MTLPQFLASCFLTICAASGAHAETITVQAGSDTFISGETVAKTIDAQADTFVVARSATIRGGSTGDLHITGFHVSVSAETREDLYAVGATVVVQGNIAQDLTALGFSVRTEDTSRTTGNARMVGKSLTIEGPIAGSLMAAGGDIVLNAPVEGDVRIVARQIAFGPDAAIGGKLTYASDRAIEVPERVAQPENVSFERIDFMDTWHEFDDIRMDMPVLPTFMSMLSGFLVSLFFLIALGAIFLGFLPNGTEAMRRRVSDAPGKSIVSGIVGLSMLFGLVPITALTIIGLPIVPIALLAIVAVWIFGYALGAYSVAMRLWQAFGNDRDVSNVGRLVVYALAITVVALLNFIPFVGWVANYTLVLLGIGGITNAVLSRFIQDPDGALDVDMSPRDN